MYTLYFYIHFTEQADKLVNSPQEYEKLISHVVNMLDRADCEKGAVLSFSEDNAEQFVSNLAALKEFEEFIGTYSSAEVISKILLDLSVHNWPDKQLHETDEWKKFYRHFAAGARIVSDNCPDVLKETAERIAMNLQQNGDIDKLLILDIGNSFPEVSHISVIRGVEQNPPQMININKVTGFKELEAWIYANIPERNYNSADNRHIEGHPEYIDGKSPILGGLGGKPRLAVLLQKAIGDARVRQILANYDEEKGAYVRYEYENVEHQNQYHGYHLVKPDSHVADVKEIQKLPPRIIKLLDYRESLD